MPLLLKFSFSYVASAEATGCPGVGWEGEFLKLRCWGQLNQKRSKNAEEDISINTCDQKGKKQKQKHEKQNHVKIWENSGFSLVFT